MLGIILIHCCHILNMQGAFSRFKFSSIIQTNINVLKCKQIFSMRWNRRISKVICRFNVIHGCFFFILSKQTKAFANRKIVMAIKIPLKMRIQRLCCMLWDFNVFQWIQFIWSFKIKSSIGIFVVCLWFVSLLYCDNGHRSTISNKTTPKKTHIHVL